MHRCSWVGNDPVYIEYHDREWGVPVYDDQRLFEMLILEGAQAGLSWITVLRKRQNYRQAFDQFDPEKIIKYDEHKVENLLKNQGIIRNRLKIESVIKNARAYLQVYAEFGTFSKYIWSFADTGPKINHWKNLKEIPASTQQSDIMSRDLKKRGFKFVGSTICYAYMQAIGMVNDHTIDCYRYKEINS